MLGKEDTKEIQNASKYGVPRAVRDMWENVVR